MKTHKKLTFTLLTLAFASAYLISGCKADNSTQPATSNKNSLVLTNDSVNCAFITFPADEITAEEVDMIKYMREEEKLARDVYTTLSTQYTLPIYKNIAQSEQRHMDFVLCLVNHYNIADPASDEIGIFDNSELQELYNNLIAQGSVSLIDALTVGATIEDTDIHDLNQYIGQTENEAITTVFDILNCGSSNHMRAFSRQLTRNNIVYIPQYISQNEYDTIVAGNNVPCGNCKGNGNGAGKGNGKGNGKGKGNGNENRNGNCDGSGKRY
jgi:hypothetical protein